MDVDQRPLLRANSGNIVPNYMRDDFDTATRQYDEIRSSVDTSQIQDFESGDGGRDSRFECNVCLDSVHDPVVTRCGHLFCWPCLYRWLNSNHTDCPVCKAGVSRDNVIPLYGRGQKPVDPRTKDVNATGENIPERPSAERIRAERPRVFGEGFNFGPNEFTAGASFSTGFGFFPSLFGLQFQAFATGRTDQQGLQSTNNMEEAQQALLSRILLILGSSVILCLLLF